MTIGKFTSILLIWVLVSSVYVLFQENQVPKNDVRGVVLEKSFECSKLDCSLSVSSTGKVIESKDVRYRIRVIKDSGEIVDGSITKKEYDSYEIHKLYNFGAPQYSVLLGFTQSKVSTPPSDGWMWLRI